MTTSATQPNASNTDAPETVTPEQMEAERIHRWGKVPPKTNAFLLSRVPAYETIVHKIINLGVAESTKATPTILAEHPFSMTIVEIEPGHGTGLHAHKTEEVFFPLDGKLIITWGPNGENEIELNPWDTISIPKLEMRAFWNRTDRKVHLLAMVGGTNKEAQGSTTYHPSVLAEIAETGATLDANGKLVEPPVGSAAQ